MSRGACHDDLRQAHAGADPASCRPTRRIELPRHRSQGAAGAARIARAPRRARCRAWRADRVGSRRRHSRCSPDLPACLSAIETSGWPVEPAARSSGNANAQRSDAGWVSSEVASTGVASRAGRVECWVWRWFSRRWSAVPRASGPRPAFASARVCVLLGAADRSERRRPRACARSSRSCGPVRSARSGRAVRVRRRRCGGRCGRRRSWSRRDSAPP